MDIRFLFELLKPNDMCYEFKETATSDVGTKEKRISLNLSTEHDCKTRYRLSDEELKVLKNFFENWREELKDDLKILRSLSGEDSNDTQDTSPTFKQLEEGASALSKEELGRQKTRQDKLLRRINDALCRIESKTFGRCNCPLCNGKVMSITRINCAPLSLWCKSEELNARIAVLKN